jgi:hydrogenase maturation protease
MGESLALESPVRVLGLGNEILADDAFGLRVASEAQIRYGPGLDVVCSSGAGLHLLDDVLGAKQVLVVDTIITGDAEPGTIRVFPEEQVQLTLGASPHASGLFDVLAKARRLALPVPDSVTIIAVEAADCTTVGGPMHPDVERAIEPTLRIIGELCHVRPQNVLAYGD